jgi:maltose/maltodextrin transport system substrate-binding protein
MGQGKACNDYFRAMGWPNLVKSKIDFGLAPIPGVNENVGRPFVGASVACLNR